MSRAREVGDLGSVTTVDSSGNVGIGTSSPAQKLEVSGSIAVSDTTTSTKRLQLDSGASSHTINSANYGSDMMDLNIQAENLIFNTGLIGVAERMRINSSGNVGIGMSSPLSVLNINSNGAPATSGNMTTGLTVSNGTGGTAINLGTYDAGGYSYIQSGYVNNASVARDLLFVTGPSEVARARTDGWFAITGNGSIPASTLGVAINRNGRYLSWCDTDWNLELGGAQVNRIRFYSSNGSGTQVGSITVNTSSTSYNTSSDYRLKENVTTLDGAADRLAQIPVHRFNFIADPNTTVDGFLAHEVQAIVPEAVTGEKDAMREEEYEVTPAVPATYDEEGNVLTEAVPAVMGTRTVPDYQGIDQSKLVPLLTAALQEALQKIDALEARVATLEGGA